MAVQSSADTVTPSPAADYDEIVAVIQLYIDGFNQAAKGKFHECFQVNAWWACTMPDGSLVQHQSRNRFRSGPVTTLRRTGNTASPP
jgi:hypothetical protein